MLTKIYAIFFHSPYWKRIRYKIKKILDLEFRKTRFRTFARYCIWRVEGHFRSVCAWQSVATCEEEAVYSMGFRWVLVHPQWPGHANYSKTGQRGRWPGHRPPPNSTTVALQPANLWPNRFNPLPSLIIVEQHATDDRWRESEKSKGDDSFAFVNFQFGYKIGSISLGDWLQYSFVPRVPV